MSQTKKTMQDLFIGLSYLLFLVPSIMAVCFFLIYWAFMADEWERKYINSLDEEKKAIILKYKHKRRMPLKYLFIKKGNKDNESK